MPGATKYARNGDVHIAYQVVGSGPQDIVLVPGWVSHVEYAWEDPHYSQFLTRLASFARLILLDRRGTGLSDRVANLPTLEERMDDVRAVMDAVGSERAVLFGLSEGGPMCMLFAATYPERTASLILYGTFARAVRDGDYPQGMPAEVLRNVIEVMGNVWGTGDVSMAFAPSLAGDEAFRASWGKFERLAVSPSGIKALIRMLHDTDARHALPVIRAPTLILHRVDDAVARVDGARYLARHIHDARYIELPGADHFPWVGDSTTMLDEIEEFVTGVRGGADTDRVLATVMFTDIVGSTEHLARLGDRAWRDLLERHHRLVRHELARFRGIEIETAGDSFLASFDGPARAVRCAGAASRSVRQLGLEIRAGVHTGECELIGSQLRGIAVHTGARIASLARAGEVLVSRTVKDLVAGSGLSFEDHGTHVLKGVPGEWRLFRAAD